MLRPARMGTDLLIVFGFLIANGLFAGAEIAVLSVRKTRLREFIRRRDKRALAVKSLDLNAEGGGVSWREGVRHPPSPHSEPRSCCPPAWPARGRHKKQ